MHATIFNLYIFSLSADIYNIINHDILYTKKMIEELKEKFPRLHVNYKYIYPSHNSL